MEMAPLVVHELTFQLCQHFHEVFVALGVQFQTSSIHEMFKILDHDSFHQIPISNDKHWISKGTVVSRYFSFRKFFVDDIDNLHKWHFPLKHFPHYIASKGKSSWLM